ncbi:uncharacterized protein LOC103679969 isoform X5 [Ursus maritimus]|uniref:Uncharacterized protein LOC103679969 isoform X5 n=1 Tax=Ursus maritimus TaxID=29073 RepID=A0A8M1FCM3_URSMA|nr:uncharacterized protein LOC103679969 isoform X5 [Ursus maritimus]
MPGTPGGRAGSGRGRVGLCVESAAGAAGVLWEAPGFGEEGGTLFQAGGGQHGQSDPEATEVGLWPLEAGIDADAGRRRQVGHHLPEVRSQARPPYLEEWFSQFTGQAWKQRSRRSIHTENAGDCPTVRSQRPPLHGLGSPAGPGLGSWGAHWRCWGEGDRPGAGCHRAQCPRSERGPSSGHDGALPGGSGNLEALVLL